MSINPMPPAPNGPPSTPAPTSQELALEFVQGVMTLLGLVGVTVPPVFTRLAVEQQIASILLVGGAILWSVINRFGAAKSRHRAAVASAKARHPIIA